MAFRIEEAKQSILRKMHDLQKTHQRLLIAIDGRCGAGKTTLAESLRDSFDCNIIHMDHFFLRPEQRTAERMSEPGGNVDYERFLSDVLMPIKQNLAFSYSSYDCRRQVMSPLIEIDKKDINIIEGTYSCHPKFIEHYDLRVFLSIDRDEQMRRIRNRADEATAKIFENKWIPLEETYFKACHVKENCEIFFHCNTTGSDV